MSEADNTPFLPPIADGGTPFPQPGIYFGMPEEVYHSIHACSAHGLGRLQTSSMDYWANSVLNQEREEEEEAKPKRKVTPHILGRAYHCRICEGKAVYDQRYAKALDKADFPTACVTVKDIREAIDRAGGKPKGREKGPLIEQLVDLDPNALVWDLLEAEYEKVNAGKVLLPFKYYRRIEIAWAMIMGDPQLKDAFSGGHAEVSIFWYDKATGAPMKARIDYLKMNWLVDLKSFANPMGKPVQRAIDAAISNHKYYIQVVVYLEAIAAAKELVKASRDKSIFVWLGNSDGWAEPCGHRETVEWCWQWAHQPEPEVLFVFQQTGVAPVTRGRIMVKGSTFTVTDYAVQFLKRKWVRCAKTFGTDPWIDVEPIVRTEDESLMFSATDFGDTA